MSAAALSAAPRSATPARDREGVRGRRPLRALRPVGVDGRPVSLESVLGSAWAGVTSGHPVACPVCGGRMVPRYGASAPTPVGGRCSDCGSVLG